MKRLLPAVLAALILTNAGCHLFSFKAKPKTPKQDKAITDTIEKEFEHRWVAKRTDELVAAGQTNDAAQAQALAEYRVKFSFTKPAQSPPP
jgi:hypothetical protein